MARYEIRIMTTNKELYEKLKKLAKQEKRTIGKQAEVCIETGLLAARINA